MFDFVGLKSVAEQGLEMLAAGGGLYLVGVSRPEVEIAVNIFGAIGGEARPGRELWVDQREARHPDLCRTVPAGPDEPGRSGVEENFTA